MSSSRLALTLAIVALAWMPLVVLSIVTSNTPDPLLLRAEPHARLLGALVVLLLAEPALIHRIGMVTRSITRDGRLRPADRDAWKSTLRRLRRWRDARSVDVVWLLLIYGTLALAYFDLLPDPALRWLMSTLHGVDWADATLTWWWYVLVAQPLLLLLLGRWLYRWALWATLVWRIARSHPDLRATHGDGVGGLGFLRLPLDALPAFALAVSISIAAVWFDEVAANEVELATFAGDLLGLLAIDVALLLLPYLALAPSLIRARERGTIEYGELAHRCTVELERRWIARGPQERGELLDRPDVSALTDLHTLTANVERMRVLIPSADNLKSMLIAALLPFLLVVLVQAPSAVDIVQAAVLRFIGH